MKSTERDELLIRVDERLTRVCDTDIPEIKRDVKEALSMHTEVTTNTTNIKGLKSSVRFVKTLAVGAYAAIVAAIKFIAMSS